MPPEWVPFGGGAAMGAERAASYSDGVLAVVATAMVVPLVHLDSATADSISTENPLSAVLASAEQCVSFATFQATFVLVVVVWMRHSRGMQGIERLDALCLAANSVQARARARACGVGAVGAGRR